MTWFQLNGQLIWKWFKDNPLLLSLLGVPISLLLIKGTQLGFEGFNGELWPQRLILFAIGFGVGCLIGSLILWVIGL